MILAPAVAVDLRLATRLFPLVHCPAGQPAQIVGHCRQRQRLRPEAPRIALPPVQRLPVLLLDPRARIEVFTPTPLGVVRHSRPTDRNSTTRARNTGGVSQGIAMMATPCRRLSRAPARTAPEMPTRTISTLSLRRPIVAIVAIVRASAWPSVAPRIYR